MANSVLSAKSESKNYIIRGVQGEKKGSAYVIYEDIFDAKNAFENLQGFNVGGRYLIVLYYNPNKMNKNSNIDNKEELKKTK